MNENQKYPIRSTLKRLLQNVTKRNKKIYLYFAFFTIAEVIYPFFAILLPKFLIGEISLGEQARTSHVLAIIGTFLALTCMFGFLRIFLQNYAYPEITKLRIDYIRDQFDKIISIDYKYMEDSNFFEVNGRAMEACSSNNNGVEGVYHKLFEIPAVFLSVLFFTVFIGRLSIFIVLAYVLNIGVNIWIKRRVHKYQYSKKEILSNAERKKRYYYNTTHDFGYGKDIRLYQFKNRILSNYGREIHNYIGIHKKIKNKEYELGFLGILAFLITNTITYGILIYQTVNGMSIADFSMYFAAITSLALMMTNLSDQISFVINEGQYVHDFYEFMDRDMGEKGGTRHAIKNDTLKIEFVNVSFKYPNTEKYIIKNLYFTINKGERLAIVGINGAGKSTLVKLMTGLFEVTEGEIRINDIPIKEYDKKELYSMFSVVFQDVNILAFTVKENVACTSEKIEEERVVKSIDRVGLGKKVEALPKGLQQMMLKVIEEDGVEFSGGESQKLAIARALYKQGNMVIMDEPTAALDALAEAEIYENFSELVQGKTAVYISHRLASTKFCDKIALFDNDGLKEYGNHEELMNLQGDYYHMFTIQGKYYSEDAKNVEEA